MDEVKLIPSQGCRIALMRGGGGKMKGRLPLDMSHDGLSQLFRLNRYIFLFSCMPPPPCLDLLEPAGPLLDYGLLQI